jgi:hypothetical protein
MIDKWLLSETMFNGKWLSETMLDGKWLTNETMFNG